MGLFSKLFGKNENSQNNLDASSKQPEQAVIVRFSYGIEGLESLHELEDKLERLISEKVVGEYDGHEIATDFSDGILYMYGPSAELLFKTIQPTLSETEFMKGAIAKLRFGPPTDGVQEIEIEI